MARRSRLCRDAHISDSIHRQLNMYALAASAAGVGMLALAEPAEAKIVFTPTHKKLIGFVPVDLNHDGKADMQFANLGGGRSGSYYSFLSARYAKSAAPEFVDTGKGFAVALHGGERIGPQRQFRSAGVLWGEKVIHSFTNHSTRTSWSGQWANGGKGVKDRYLGIKFTINGSDHYGWARVSVTISGSKVTSRLTGYAYETIPGKAIIAGATKAPEEAEPTAMLIAPASAPATVGTLALGAPGLSIWRREESVGVL